MLTAKEVRRALDSGEADSIGTSKEGVVIRRGYFYRHGMDSTKFQDAILRRLTAAGLEPKLVRSGDKWAPFRGGATVASSSHFYVIVQ